MDAQDFEPAAFVTLEPIIWRPVAAGLWRQRELFDGTYDTLDLADALEFLDVKEENERRSAAWQERQARGD